MNLIPHIEWMGDAATGHLRLLDQTRLPGESVYLDCVTVQDVWDAIKRLSVRGAPAIGIAAAYGCVIGAQRGEGAMLEAADHLATSRPTAVNLFWAIKRMKGVRPRTAEVLLAEARHVHEEDAAMCRRIGEHALPLLQAACGLRPRDAQAVTGEQRAILTHCNAGALATGGIGTATAPMYLAHERGLGLTVFADETRPLLQGSRLTAYELQRAGIDVVLICDGMAAQAMRQGRIGAVIVGADRIAANGDTANKIGTYSLAVLAKHHALPFYVAAPSSTFDLSLAGGQDIPIEHRGSEEITHGFGKATAPAGVKTYSPAFDVTPHELVTAIVTERGVIQPVDRQHVADKMKR
ncbi:MAG: S-methyl-5-thioribose-1-phosphate isomerase [Phycisphaeraceae bacterium]